MTTSDTVETSENGHAPRAGAFTITAAAAARSLRSMGVGAATDEAVAGWCARKVALSSIGGEPVLTAAELEELRVSLVGDPVVVVAPPQADPPSPPRYDAPGTCTLCGKENVPLPFKNPGVYDGTARICAACGPTPGAPPPLWSRPRPAAAAVSAAPIGDLLVLSAFGWTLRVGRAGGGVTVDLKRS